jgi:hypothetical protein
MNTFDPEQIPFGVTDLEPHMDRWQRLAPNYPNQDDLQPGDMTAADIVEVAAAFTAGEEEFELPSLGEARIVPVGRGETKVCSRLETAAGIMAVQRLSSPISKPHIPSRRELSVVETFGRERRLEYSGARVYLRVPLSPESSIRFQEWAGTASESKLSVGKMLDRMEARRRAMLDITHATPNIQPAHLASARDEAKKPRHHLYKKGHKIPLLIDITFNEYRESEYERFPSGA